MAIRKFYRRKSYRKRRPFYRKKNSRTYKIAKRAAKTVIKQTAEKKYINNQWNVAGVTTTAQLYDVCQNIAQGTGALQRVGDKINLLKWRLRLLLRPNSSQTGITKIRTVVCVPRDNKNILSSADFPAGASNMTDGLDLNKLYPLYDKVVSLYPYTGGNISEKWLDIGKTFKFGKKIRYERGGSSVAEGSIYIVQFSDKTTLTPSMDGNFRVVFNDL